MRTIKQPNLDFFVWWFNANFIEYSLLHIYGIYTQNHRYNQACRSETLNVDALAMIALFYRSRWYQSVLWMCNLMLSSSLFATCYRDSSYLDYSIWTVFSIHCIHVSCSMFNVHAFICIFNIQQIFSDFGFWMNTLNTVQRTSKRRENKSNLAMVHAFEFLSVFPLIHMQLNVQTVDGRSFVASFEFIDSMMTKEKNSIESFKSAKIVRLTNHFSSLLLKTLN